jgi:hypothetical protein
MKERLPLEIYTSRSWGASPNEVIVVSVEFPAELYCKCFQGRETLLNSLGCERQLAPRWGIHQAPQLRHVLGNGVTHGWG